MRALISDIHANLEALEAVLADIAKQGVAEIYCLGDIVGYGPNPRECLELVMRHARLTVLGNHDEAARTGPTGFNAEAAKAVWWTRQQLQDTREPARVAERRWKFLAGLPQTVAEGDTLFVHASPRSPLRDYVFPEDARNTDKMCAVFARIQRRCFAGHTHVPGIFTVDGRFLAPEEIGGHYRCTSHKILCNVGSVGQPRDGDPRACYVLCDETEIVFRRVPYDVERTIEKIRQHPELDASYLM
jgi:diadenosine tetraphosphatase ApaH/serine/threonine PP2A family protein phosphatase